MRTKIDQELVPSDWKRHRFGISEYRWENFEGKSFWITGAGTGYGRSIALALTAAGSTTFITGRRSEKLQDTVDEGTALGIDMRKCFPVAADITSTSSLRDAVLFCARKTQALFGLINCAAVPQRRSEQYPLLDDLVSWEEIWQTNLTGQLLTCRSAMPLLSNGDSFRIVFLTSEAGWADTLGYGPYNVSKSALNSFGMSFAAECSAKYPKKDIQINVLDPGEAKTEMNQGSPNSPFSVVTMVLVLLSQPIGGPNGYFFHRDGRHLSFGHKRPFLLDLLGS